MTLVTEAMMIASFAMAVLTMQPERDDTTMPEPTAFDKALEAGLRDLSPADREPARALATALVGKSKTFADKLVQTHTLQPDKVGWVLAQMLVKAGE